MMKNQFISKQTKLFGFLLCFNALFFWGGGSAITCETCLSYHAFVANKHWHPDWKMCSKTCMCIFFCCSYCPIQYLAMLQHALMLTGKEERIGPLEQDAASRIHLLFPQSTPAQSTTLKLPLPTYKLPLLLKDLPTMVQGPLQH